MKPSFSFLFKGYPLRHVIMREMLYDELGWPDLKAHKAFGDTCAIRMSVALNSAGVPVPGWLKVKAGPLKGKSIEPSQAKLSRWIKASWGQPEIFKSEDAATRGIGNRTGVVSFWGVDGTAQGHIDLVKPDGNGFHSCAMSCFFKSREIWFWPVL
ncbi:T6SS effector amidase Tae4 family protein [Massilia glaciei]|uniref:Type VI secretion system amidase effector protein Tae4 n=1 Tax=Massilia glaciei TaxID=1524097 RepID=A0A2U2HMS7_9BURK|nr:T6SS effector amidase Tae4 family protein [Massilia glaciei]PWF48807.1 hypothetical protein C7C56_010060 [Massilia glaciei]